MTSDLIRKTSVAELELAFAQNPESSAYADLCRAYIDQSRFMEAMVVCKKGIKSHPDSIEGRVLLAQVYGAQKKFKRAIQELDELAKERPTSGDVFLARGRMKLEAEDKSGAIDDLKKGLDVEPGLAEATALLAELGVEYPEKPVSPPPSPPVFASAPSPQLPSLSPPAVFVASGPSQPAERALSGGEFVLPRGISAPSVPSPDDHAFEMAPRAISAASSPPVPPSFSVAPSGAAGYPYALPPRGVSMPPMRQRLEGEDALEGLANRVAEEKPERGKPKATLVLAIGLFVLCTGLFVHRITEKRRIEAIDRLTTEAAAAFNKDTYGSYKVAAAKYEEILDRHDSNHALTLGRLAHVYAILVGEHGEVDKRAQLDAILARADARAPRVSHTIAAKGLQILYDGKDRQGNAAKAMSVVAPIVQQVKEADGGPSYADLTMAILDLELGNYESATQTLGEVKQVLPGSVRAKVWHARAAYRASRLATSEAAFLEALRAEPMHPGARAGLALTRIVRGDLNGAAEQLVKFDELPEKEISSRDRGLAEFARSEVFRTAGEESRALGAYEMAVRLDPGNADFPYGLGKSLLENDKAKEALPHLKKAVDMEKTRVSFLITLAEAEMRLDDYKSAERHVQDVMAKAPGALEAMLARARLLRRTRNPETEAFLKKVLEKHPSAESEINLELGRYLRAIGKLDEAKTALEAAIGKMGGYAPAKQADIVLSYAKLLKDRGETEMAAKSYRQAADLGNLEASYWLAVMLARGSRDEREEAKRACEKYLGAGASLTYSREARELCDDIR